MEFTKKNGKRRVVITGAGMISGLGKTWDEAYEQLKSYKNCIKDMEEWHDIQGMNTHLACPAKGELPKYPRKLVRGMGRVSLLSYFTTEQALKMANLLNEDGTIAEECHNGRTGVAYGSSMGSFDSIVELTSVMQDRCTAKVNSSTYIKCMPHTCAANIEVTYQLRGRMIVTSEACTSGSQSIGYAYETIENGLQDIMIAGGAEELCPPDAAIFDQLGSTSILNDTPDKTPKPFDKDRDGLVIGEGAGTLILEDLEHAVKRGAKIYAEIVGFGTNTDGTHITSPNSETMGICMQLALDSAGLDGSKIAYVNAHGTSTHHGDIAESTATERIFKRPIPISSTKSYIGHTLGACGAVEAWLTINMMNEGWFHPTLNLQNVDEECGKLDYIIGEGRKIDAEYVMSNNFAFAGINTSLIFKKWHDE